MQITEQREPRLDQLDKIVESLCLLIEMQCERDERQELAFSSFTNQLSTLDEKVSKIEAISAAADAAEAEIDEELSSIFAKYSVGAKVETAETDQDADANTEDSKEEQSKSSAEENDENEIVQAETADHEAEQPTEEPPVREIPMMDLEEIAEIKAQLHEKLREAEMELSLRRAKLSNREALIEEREVALNREIQRHMRMANKIEEPSNANTMLGRLKVHLREFSAAKMAKAKEAEALKEREIEELRQNPNDESSSAIEPERE